MIGQYVATIPVELWKGYTVTVAMAIERSNHLI